MLYSKYTEKLLKMILAKSNISEFLKLLSKNTFKYFLGNLPTLTNFIKNVDNYYEIIYEYDF